VSDDTLIRQLRAALRPFADAALALQNDEQSGEETFTLTRITGGCPVTITRAELRVALVAYLESGE
jgi:hypothetical protein